jgi:hypothetical protein
VVEEEPKRAFLAAGDRVLDRCDVEDIDRRIGRSSEAGIGREHPRDRREITEECRGEDVVAGTGRQQQRLDGGAAPETGRAERRHV